MRTADLVTATLLLLLGALVVWDSLRIGIGWGTSGPMSGFFPFWLAVILIAASLGTLLQAALRRVEKPFVTRESLVSVLKVLGPASGMVLLTEFIGLYAAAGLYLAFYMRWIGKHSWALIAAVSVAFPVIAFFVFETWFLVPMPKGPIEDWLGY